jgi:branched-chain amino acid transport system permease protein
MTKPWWRAVALLWALVAYPLLVPDFWTLQIGAQSLMLGTIALSLIFLAGYCGILSLAQMAVAGLAGYAVAYFGVNTSSHGVPLAWPFSVAMGLVAGTAGGLLVGMIAVRTAGIYTLMITLAIAVGFANFARQNYATLNGYDGFAGVKAPILGGISLRDPRPFYYLALAAAVLALAAVLGLARTPLGLALQGLRDNQRRLSALGYATAAYKILAFGVAGLIAGTGGVLSVWYHGRISPGSIDLGRTIDILVIAVVGGMSHPLGAFLGAAVFVLVENFAIDFVDPERFNTLIGLVFLVIVLFSPDGLIGLGRRIGGLYERKLVKAARTGSSG